MNKEEIREEIARSSYSQIAGETTLKYFQRLNQAFKVTHYKFADQLLSLLDPYVRIVKEIELPDLPKRYCSELMLSERIAYLQAQQEMVKAFNESLERLI